MRRIVSILLIVIIGISCLSVLASQVLAQESTEPTLPPPLVVRWMRFRGAVTKIEDDPYHGMITVKIKTANLPIGLFKPWIRVNLVWSNESRPIDSSIKPVGEVTYTHYSARLVRLITIRGRQEAINLNVTGIWNINKVKITSEFDENNLLINRIWDVTPIARKAKGQLHLTEDWKTFDLEIEDIETITGIGINMTTRTRRMNPFSYAGEPKPTLNDLFRITKCFRASPGFGNFNHELDHNFDSKIDIADLTTVAANM